MSPAGVAVTVWQPTQQSWHALSGEEVLALLQSDTAHGLSHQEAQRRLQLCGANALPAISSESLWQLLLHQFSDFMIIVLLLAAAVSGLLGELVDALAIIIIILLNAIIGVVQEYRAEQALAALRAMHAPQARVVRDGVVTTLPSSELVPGDVVLLEAGDLIAADLRLLEGHALAINEAALSGESLAVGKALEKEAAGEDGLTIHSNIAYMGTQLVAGRGRGVVVASGRDTELGRIATLLDTAMVLRTPLQQRLLRFGRALAWSVLAICLLIFVVGLLRGEQLLLMFLTAVSLAVAAIPEALPAVVTISLALGAHRMVKQQALIRRLPAVETLGSVSVICTDKTGTLTENRMVLDRLICAGGREVVLAAQGEATAPQLSLGTLLAISNDVEQQGSEVRGDPTELALWEAAEQAGFRRAALVQQLPRVGEFPFDATRKRMTTLHRARDGVVLYSKGAPEAILPLCTRQLQDGQPVALQRGEWESHLEAMTQQGYRVLALAMRALEVGDTFADESVERDLVLLALVGLIDPPRSEAAQAVAECKAAGILPLMITGDHPGTAFAIAQRLAMADQPGQVITGSELAQLDEAALQRRIDQLRVYARVTPEQKLRIVRALQQRGEFVAMTGDGVNDAPALKQAEIGVAMGKKGTAVAREAADMVLLDDNFATIVTAVREGRRIYDNVRKFVKYTMTSNAGEIWTLLLAPLLGLPLPLLPLQILWINLVTDGLPGLAQTVEREERNTMQRPPRPPQESIFAHGMWQHILWVGLLIGGVSLLGQAWAWYGGSSHWQTIVFTVLTFSQLVHVLAIRSERDSLFVIGLASNRPLLAAVGLTLMLQLLVIYLPILNELFKTQPLTVGELAVSLLLPLVVLVAVELEKFAYRRGWIYGAQR